MDRVKWFRDRADRDRFREEVEILEAEFQRTVISFGRMSEVWSQMATDATGPGSVAYAHRKAAIIRGKPLSSVALRCQHSWGCWIVKVLVIQPIQ